MARLSYLLERLIAGKCGKRGTPVCTQHSVTLMTCPACADAEGWAVSDNSDSGGRPTHAPARQRNM